MARPFRRSSPLMRTTEALVMKLERTHGSKRSALIILWLIGCGGADTLPEALPPTDGAGALPAPPDSSPSTPNPPVIGGAASNTPDVSTPAGSGEENPTPSGID